MELPVNLTAQQLLVLFYLDIIFCLLIGLFLLSLLVWIHRWNEILTHKPASSHPSCFWKDTPVLHSCLLFVAFFLSLNWKVFWNPARPCFIRETQNFIRYLRPTQLPHVWNQLWPELVCFSYIYCICVFSTYTHIKDNCSGNLPLIFKLHVSN